MILAALEREWRRTPDERLGQVVVNLLRANRKLPREEEGRILFGVEDGELLRWLGPETEQERRYVEDEPRMAREGWAKARREAREDL